MAIIYVASSGSPSANGTALQAAITAADPGDTITLDPGGVYQGNLVIPDKGISTDWISIEPGDAGGSFISAFPFRRVTPDDATLCPRIETNTNGYVVEFAQTAHHWKFRGLHITTTDAPGQAGLECPALVIDSQTGTYESHAHHLTFDRCILHPYETDPLLWRACTHAFLLNAAHVEIVRCYCYDFMGFIPMVPTTSERYFHDQLAGGVLFGTVVSATNSDPVQVTIEFGSMPDPGHKMLMSFSGGTGNWAGLNGTKVATWVSSTVVSLQNYDTSTFALSNINSTSWGAVTGTIALLTHDISTSCPLTIVWGPGPYLVEDCFFEGYYTQLFTGGGRSLIPAENIVTVTSDDNPVDQVTLSGVGAGGPAPLQVGDLIAFRLAEPQAVSAATSASPCVLTVAPHRFSPVGGRIGAFQQAGVAISGATGDWGVLNYVNDTTGHYYGKVLDAGGGVPDTTHIALYLNEALTIPLDTTGIGQPLTGTVTWLPQSPGPPTPERQWSVGQVTAMDGNQITYDFYGHTNGLVGNGAGVPVRLDSPAQFNGRVIDGITVRRSTLSNRRSWLLTIMHVADTGDTTGHVAKGFWESKNAINVLMDGCIVQIDGAAITHRTGTVGIGLNQSSQEGDTPWMQNSHWVVRNCWFKNVVYNKLRMVEEYFSGLTSTDFLFENNLFGPAGGAFLSLEGTDNVRVIHNTARNKMSTIGYKSWLIVFNGVNSGTLLRDNIGDWLLYGYNNEAGWSPTLQGNHLIDSEGQNFTPLGTDVRVVSDAAMQFVDETSADAGGDHHGYRLADGSPYKNAASDGKDPGVDFALLDGAISGGESTRGGGRFINAIFRVRY